MAAVLEEVAVVFKSSYSYSRCLSKIVRRGRPSDQLLLKRAQRAPGVKIRKPAIDPRPLKSASSCEPPPAPSSPLQPLVQASPASRPQIPPLRISGVSPVTSTVRPTRGKIDKLITQKHQEQEEEEAEIDESITYGPEEIVIQASKQNPAFIDGEQGTFKSLGLRDDVIKSLESIGATYPTVIQMNTIPKILQREHVMCAAQTGSGKTLAYLAPIINMLKTEEILHGIAARIHRPRACVVVPSRELAVQVLRVAKLLHHHVKFSSMGLIGGWKKKWMREGLAKQMDLVVATPGSLLKYRQRGELFFSDLSYLVIDEADTMFDHSFTELTQGLLKEMPVRYGPPAGPEKLPVDMQVTLVCATLPEKLMNRTLKDIIPNLQISTSGLHKVLPHIKHTFLKTLQENKAQKLVKLLRNDARSQQCTMVFCNTTQSCNWLSYYLENHQIEHVRLNGDIPSEIRCQKYREILEGKVKVVLCTDIASRGLDTTQVSHVVNFDFPTTTADYIHRVGRTGRVGAVNQSATSAQATSFVTHKRDVRLAILLERAAKRNKALDGIEMREKKIKEDFPFSRIPASGLDDSKR